MEIVCNEKRARCMSQYFDTETVKYTLRFVSRYWYLQYILIQISTCMDSLRCLHIDTDDIDTSFPIYYLYRYFDYQYLSILRLSICIDTSTINMYRYFDDQYVSILRLSICIDTSTTNMYRYLNSACLCSLPRRVRGTGNEQATETNHKLENRRNTVKDPVSDHLRVTTAGF